MGVYVAGTLWSVLMAGYRASLDIFDVRALAVVGSGRTAGRRCSAGRADQNRQRNGAGPTIGAVLTEHNGISKLVFVGSPASRSNDYGSERPPAGPEWPGCAAAGSVVCLPKDEATRMGPTATTSPSSSSSSSSIMLQMEWRSPARRCLAQCSSSCFSMTKRCGWPKAPDLASPARHGCSNQPVPIGSPASCALVQRGSTANKVINVMKPP